MKKIHRVLLICFSFIFVHKSSTNMPQVSSAITYELNGGRFGDNLESFARAKYIGWLNGIPVRVFPFPYADHLMLYELEQLLCVEDFDNVVRLSSMYGPFRKYSNTLYINHWRVKVPINWNDLGFIEELKKVIAPRHDMNLVDIPEGYLSVAVHVRTGGGYSADNQQEKERCPLRFVSDEFYISQIGLIAEMYPDREIYVHIFTDHKNPSEVVEKYSKALQNDRLTFACQSGENAHNLNVLEDFFSMMKFECLIRAGSHFSRFVERLGQTKLVLYPDGYKRVGKDTIINVIGLKTRLSSGKWKSEKIKL